MAPVTDKQRILIVDDDPNMLELLCRHLCARGYEVVTVSGMSEFIHVLAAKPVDLVITALKSFNGGGLDVITHIRKNFSRTEVVIVTGYSAIREAVSAAKAGGAEYLVKPFTEDELLDSVHSALGKLSGRQAGMAPAGSVRSARETIVNNSSRRVKMFGSKAG